MWYIIIFAAQIPQNILMTLTRILIAIAFLVASSTCVNAQKLVSKSKNAEAYAGKVTKRKPGETIDEFISMTKDEFKIKLRSKDTYEFVTYDSDLNQIDSRTEQIVEKKKKDYGKADWYIFEFGESRYLLKGITDRDNEQNVFNITEIDENDDEVASPIELATIKGKEYYYVIENADLDYDFSDDGSKLMVSFKLPELRDKDNIKYKRYQYFVFNEDMQLEWSKVVDFKHKGGRNQYGGAARVSNDGEIYGWARVDRGRSYKKQERWSLDLYRFNKDEEASTTIKGVDPNGITTDIRDGVYSLFSTYSVRGFVLFGFGNPGGHIGFLSVKWNGGDREKPQVLKTAFGAEHASKNQPTKERKKHKAREKKDKDIYIPHLVVDEVILLEDGSHLVIAQEKFSVTTTSKSGFTRTKYYNLDIHIFGLDSEFRIQWSNIIPCYQLMGSTVHSGYVRKLIGDKLYFVFNDNYRNLEKEWNTTKKPNRFSGGDHPTSIVTLDLTDPEAKQKRELLWKSKSVGGSFRTDLYYSPDDLTSGLVYIQGGKLKQGLVRIDYQ